MNQHDSLTIPSGREFFRDFYKQQLLEDTLPFWFPRCVDHEYGGFLHCIDRDGSRIDNDKSVWAQGRMCWMLLTLYNSIGDHEQRDDWLRWSEAGLVFLERHCFAADGHMLFHVTREGQPIRKRRYAYSEAFAAIAYAQHYQATGIANSAERATTLFDYYMHWNFEPGVMPAKFEATRPMIGLAPRLIAIVTAQELRSAIGNQERWTNSIDRCIDEIQRLFVHPECAAVMESVSPSGNIIDSPEGRCINPGHAMEAAWFILHEGHQRNRKDYQQLGAMMVEWMWNWGWDTRDGGILYFRDVYSKPNQEYWHDMKFWWPHNETTIATLLAYLCTGDPKFAEWHRMVHEWSHSRFYDPLHGEWFGYLHRDGSLSTTTKGNLWKSFFHLPRMQWMCWQSLCDPSWPIIP
jgi:N-acylglucosamine 2-epimerase